MNAKNLEKATYSLQTSLGTSTLSYSHNTTQPIYGIGQGAGNSPVVWCTISSTLFDTYSSKATGATFHLPDQSLSSTIPMVGFVDNTSGSTNSFLLPHNTPLQHHLHLATQDAQHWNDLLQLTGGALESTKCSYHAIFYKFGPTGVQLQGKPPKSDISIYFNISQHKIPLPQLSNYEPHKTLGVWKSRQTSCKIQKICKYHSKKSIVSNRGLDILPLSDFT